MNIVITVLDHSLKNMVYGAYHLTSRFNETSESPSGNVAGTEMELNLHKISCFGLVKI